VVDLNWLCQRLLDLTPGAQLHFCPTTWRIPVSLDGVVLGFFDLADPAGPSYTHAHSSLDHVLNFGVYRIPAGAKPTPCQYCGMSIYFAEPHPGTASKAIPVSLADLRCYAPTDDAPGWGINHHLDCKGLAKKEARP